MSKAAEVCRVALDREISRWNGFLRALREPEREAFEELMDMFKNNPAATSADCSSFIFESMVMSILIAQQLKIKQLENKLQPLKPQTPNHSAYPILNQISRSSQAQKTLIQEPPK